MGFCYDVLNNLHNRKQTLCPPFCNRHNKDGLQEQEVVLAQVPGLGREQVVAELRYFNLRLRLVQVPALVRVLAQERVLGLWEVEVPALVLSL
jgi:hypothetical protein